MSNIWFCSDLHFGHKAIERFRAPCGITSEEHNRAKIKYDWNSVVKKKDTVYVLGDAVFKDEFIEDFAFMNGKKILIRGNHDILPTSRYLEFFDEVYGLLKYKEFWLSHSPIHPDELRGKINLHGHVHFNTVQKKSIFGSKNDPRYFNCCPENLWAMPEINRAVISLEDVRNVIKRRGL